MLPLLMILWRDRHDRIFAKSIKPIQGLLILVILLQLGQSFLTMYLPTINSRVIDYGVANADAAYIMHQEFSCWE